MVQFDNQYRRIKIKVVFYGPALGGKTTCIQHIHRVTDPQRRTKLYSLNTASDRTLFFDLLSLNLGRIRGYRLALQLYTVPGQVQYNATRKTVLAGADGIIFVADSQIDQHRPNLASLESLWEYLAANGLDRRRIPLVFVLNKRDLEPVQSIVEMEKGLNPDGLPSFPSVAITGEGVLEAFSVIGERTLAAVADKLGVGTNPEAIRRLQKQMRIAMEPFVQHEEVPPERDVAVTIPTEETDPTQALSEEALVGEAVRANLSMTDLNARLDSVGRQLERKVRVMASIAEFGRAVSNERDPANVLRLLITSTIRHLQVQGAAVMIIPASGQLREAVVHGFKRDPLIRTNDQFGGSAALALLNERKPQLITRDIDNESDHIHLAAVENAGFSSVLAVPLMTQERLVGLLTAYGDRDRSDLDEDDLQLATVLGSAAAMGYANAIAWRQVQDFNRSLETQVAERTSEIRTAMAEAQRLADDLAEKNHLLEDAYRDIAALDHVKNELITRLSSELRAPVTSLLTAAKILNRSKDAPLEKNARFVEIIYDEAEKMSEIIQSIFQASVLAGGADAPERRDVPAADLIRRAIAPLRDLARQREVSLHILIPSGLSTISCEGESTEAALRAVIKNAIEFNHNGGQVKLEVRRVMRDEKPWLMLCVTDTGVGIPDQELAHVCEAFWQGGNVLSGKPRGVGLGLAIAKRVAEHHGGSLLISSTVAEGTEVTMTLPQFDGFHSSKI
jgi:signal transduction histidine kinase/signal recognition particle receptor subunit beta